MSYFTRHEVTLTMDTSTDGTATAYTSGFVNGYIHSIRYVHSDFSTKCHLKITGDVTGIPIVNELTDFPGTGVSNTYYPRADTMTATGGYLYYEDTSTVGSNRVQDKIAVADERVKLEITTSSSTGADTGSGTFYILAGG